MPKKHALGEKSKKRGEGEGERGKRVLTSFGPASGDANKSDGDGDCSHVRQGTLLHLLLCTGARAPASHARFARRTLRRRRRRVSSSDEEESLLPPTFIMPGHAPPDTRPDPMNGGLIKGVLSTFARVRFSMAVLVRLFDSRALVATRFPRRVPLGAFLPIFTSR